MCVCDGCCYYCAKTLAKCVVLRHTSWLHKKILFFYISLVFGGKLYRSQSPCMLIFGVFFFLAKYVIFLRFSELFCLFFKYLVTSVSIMFLMEQNVNPLMTDSLSLLFTRHHKRFFFCFFFPCVTCFKQFKPCLHSYFHDRSFLFTLKA